MNNFDNLPPGCSPRDIDATCPDQGYDCRQCDRRVDELFDTGRDEGLCEGCYMDLLAGREAAHEAWVADKLALGWSWQGDRWVPPNWILK